MNKHEKRLTPLAILAAAMTATEQLLPSHEICFFPLGLFLFLVLLTSSLQQFQQHQGALLRQYLIHIAAHIAFITMCLLSLINVAPLLIWSCCVFLAILLSLTRSQATLIFTALVITLITTIELYNDHPMWPGLSILAICISPIIAQRSTAGTYSAFFALIVAVNLGWNCFSKVAGSAFFSVASLQISFAMLLLPGASIGLIPSCRCPNLNRLALVTNPLATAIGVIILISDDSLSILAQHLEHSPSCWLLVLLPSIILTCSILKSRPPSLPTILFSTAYITTLAVITIGPSQAMLLSTRILFCLMLILFAGSLITSQQSLKNNTGQLLMLLVPFYSLFCNPSHPLIAIGLGLIALQTSICCRKGLFTAILRKANDNRPPEAPKNSL